MRARQDQVDELVDEENHETSQTFQRSPAMDFGLEDDSELNLAGRFEEINVNAVEGASTTNKQSGIKDLQTLESFSSKKPID